MKVIDEGYTDRSGRTVIKFQGVKRLQEIQDYLQRYYQGYKFGMIFDCTKDEIEEVGNEYWVYYLDEMHEEVMTYADYTPDMQDGKKIWKRRY